MSFLDFALKTYTIVLPIVLGYIVWLLQQNRKDTKAKKQEDEKARKAEDEKLEASMQGIMFMLRHILKSYHTEYICQGYITSDQLKDYNEIFEVYTKLGGNSVALRWHEEINELCIREPGHKYASKVVVEEF